MKTTITIHIGLHKTGTTSIQATLFRNRDRLKGRGVNYFGLNENHSETLYPLFLTEPHLYRQNRLAGIDTPQKAARKNAATEKALRRELGNASGQRFIISGEDLSLLSREGVARLRALFSPYGDLRIVVYVRDPYDVITSAFQARLRLGETYDQIIAAPPNPGYGFIRPFIEEFGRDQVDIRIFDPARFAGGNLISDFLAAAGAPAELPREIEIVRANEAVSNEAAFLIHEINKQHRQRDRSSPNPARAPNLADILETVPGAPFVCPPEAMAAAAPLFADDLRWLRGVLGEDIFSERPDSATPTPRWSEPTLAALAVLLNDLARDAEQQPAGVLGRMLRRAIGETRSAR
jgi:hypothetical protein